MAGYVEAKTANTVPSGGPSPIIWADCPVVTILRDPGVGIHIFEDFVGNLTTLAAAGQAGPYFQLVGTNPVIKIHEDYDDLGGAVDIEGGGSGDDEVYLVSNIVYELKMNNNKKMWFEAKFKFEDADADQTFLCGLGEASLLAADALADEGANRNKLADYDFVGFHADNDGSNMDVIDAVYHEDDDGGAVTKVDEDVVTINGTDYDDVYIRLGMKFDGKKTVTFYVDGVATGTTLDIDDFATNTANELDPLGVILGAKDLVGSAAKHICVDWIRFACEK